MNWQDSPKCKCGHLKYDHPFSGSCDPGDRSCRCTRFIEAHDKEDN